MFHITDYYCLFKYILMLFMILHYHVQYIFVIVSSIMLFVDIICYIFFFKKYKIVLDFIFSIIMFFIIPGIYFIFYNDGLSFAIINIFTILSYLNYLNTALYIIYVSLLLCLGMIYIQYSYLVLIVIITGLFYYLVGIKIKVNYFDYNVKSHLTKQLSKIQIELDILSEAMKIPSKQLVVNFDYLSFRDINNILLHSIEILELKKVHLKSFNIIETIERFAKKHNIITYLYNRNFNYDKKILIFLLEKLILIPTYKECVISSNDELMIFRFEYNFHIDSLKEDILFHLKSLKNILSYLKIKCLFDRHFIVMELERNVNIDINIYDIFTVQIQKLLFYVDASYIREKNEMILKMIKHNVSEDLISEVCNCSLLYIKKVVEDEYKKSV